MKFFGLTPVFFQVPLVSFRNRRIIDFARTTNTPVPCFWIIRRHSLPLDSTFEIQVSGGWLGARSSPFVEFRTLDSKLGLWTSTSTSSSSLAKIRFALDLLINFWSRHLFISLGKLSLILKKKHAILQYHDSSPNCIN